ncbi:MAG: ABC transporter substrate-binding protein, partial [Anaerolineales bacterium]|nr:ABC transporter substrate-binding protein [Anaerolineales bacterium]
MKIKPKSRYYLGLISLFIVSALVLTSCGGTKQVSQVADLPVEGQTSTDEPMKDETHPIFRVAFQPIVQTDPALISSDSEVFVANAVYDYLIDVDSKSKPVPRLALDWSVSDDGLLYTFNLADYVTFHDGTPFSAADVVWTYDRLRNPDLGFATSSLYGNIISIDAVDDHTVAFTLENPNPFFLYDLSDNHALIIKNGTEDASDFNGTGPFVVTNYSPEDRIILEANPDYFL